MLHNVFLDATTKSKFYTYCTIKKQAKAAQPFILQIQFLQPFPALISVTEHQLTSVQHSKGCDTLATKPICRKLTVAGSFIFHCLSQSTLSPKLNIESEWFLSPECWTSCRLCCQCVPGLKAACTTHCTTQVVFVTSHYSYTVYTCSVLYNKFINIRSSQLYSSYLVMFNIRERYQLSHYCTAAENGIRHCYHRHHHHTQLYTPIW